MTRYEFRCLKCGCFLLSNYPSGRAPEITDKLCPSCDSKQEFRRWYSFGIPPGSNGEGFRSSQNCDNDD